MKTYGRLKLDGWSRGFLKAATERALRDMKQNASQTEDGDELAFYRSTSEWMEILRSKLQDAPAGRIAFSERELRGLRGLLSGSKASMLVEYQTATFGNDAHRASDLTEEFKLVDGLDALLARPFLNDQSQDAEEEDEAEDEDDDGARP